MKQIAFFLLLTVLVGCKTTNDTGNVIESTDAATFVLELGEDALDQSMIADGTLSCSGCSVSLESIAGKPAIGITTDQEFSDGFIDLKKLYGYPINFREADYLELELYVPKDSWITALKFNYKDDEGNFGGCHEIANNFHGNYDRWIKVKVDLKEALADCKNWVGDKSPIPNTASLSLNPYNTHQADSSAIYVHRIWVGNDLPAGDFVAALSAKPDTITSPFVMDFEDTPHFRQILAYRGFESSGQAFGKNKFGNPTNAVRLKNSNDVKRKFTCFLPMFDKVTGSPVDFTKVKKIYFDYYLTEESDAFEDATLFLTGQHWGQILKDSSAIKGFKTGSWERAEIYMDSLDLRLVKGEVSPISEVYELRLDLNYLPGKKNTEMWMDNFGWE